MRTLLPRNINLSRIRKKWHKDIEEQEQLSVYLARNSPQPDATWIDSSAHLIQDLVVGSESFSSKRDEILRQLINEHEERSPSTKPVAVLACLPSFQLHAAAEQLTGLKSSDIERYLRCVLIASQLCRPVVSPSETRIVRALLSFTEAGQRTAIESFSELIETINTRTDATFLCEDTVRWFLTHHGIRDRLEAWVHDLLQENSLDSLHRCISRLHVVSNSRTAAEAVRLQDEFFPSMDFLRSWRPEQNRIRCWEHGRFDTEQRAKLSQLFQLDGPDTQTMIKPRLYLSEDVQHQQASRLEALLQTLHSAETIGHSALDLFISLYVDSCPDTTAATLLERCLGTGDDSFCEVILSLRKASARSASLDKPIKHVIHALRVVSSTSNIDLACTLGNVPTLVADLWARAQRLMLQKLSRGSSGEYIGMAMHDFSLAVLDVPWLRARVDQALLNQMKKLPSRDVLIAIFRHLQSSDGAQGSRFKSFVECSLGGQGTGTGGNITLEAIQVEVDFWRLPPDTVQSDLAGAISKVPFLDYSCYTECLSGIMKEKPQYVRELRLIMQSGTTETCHALVEFLRKRRLLNQMKGPCWLLLLVAVIRNQDESQDGQYFVKIAMSMTYQQWQSYTTSLQSFFGTIVSQLPENGNGLTRRMLTAWDEYSRCPAVKFLIDRQTGRKKFLWIYFPQNWSCLEALLERIRDERALTVLKRRVLSVLDEGGANLRDVVNCFHSIESLECANASESEREELNTATMLSELCMQRRQNGWPLEESRLLSRVSYGGLSNQVSNILLGRLDDSEEPRPSNIRSLAQRLLAVNGMLIERARKVERSRDLFRRNYPNRTRATLDRIGVENPAATVSSSIDIDDDLVDSVEAISASEFAMSFPLTGLSDLQRLAKGIPADARMFLARIGLCDESEPTFCLHFSNEESSQHQPWVVTGDCEPTESICNARLKLFIFYVARQLFPLLKDKGSRNRSLVKSIHTLIQTLIEQPPQTCMNGTHQLTTKLWKPAVCSRDCSWSMIRNSPLEVRLHNLLVDPSVIDLLLTSLYNAAADPATLRHMRGCPVARDRIAAVINSMPPLTTLQSAANLRTAIRAGNDQLGVDRERLLSWLCLKFRGFMLSPPDGFKVPNMGHAKQFLLVNSHHEKEAAYKAASSAAGSTASSGLVFHGTHPSRLFYILANGLQIQRGAGVLNGAAYGHGIYLGDDMSTSLAYARFTGSSWRNSALGNMSVMLGCELAAYGRSIHHPIHVVTDERRVLVRYVFLLPQGFRCPPKHHVEPAILNSFAVLRSGVS